MSIRSQLTEALPKSVPAETIQSLVEQIAEVRRVVRQDGKPARVLDESTGTSAVMQSRPQPLAMADLQLGVKTEIADVWRKHGGKPDYALISRLVGGGAS